MPNVSRSSASVRALLAAVEDDELPLLRFDWSFWSRLAQQPPKGDWTTWLLMGGRGSGKTLPGSNWVRQLAAEEIGPIAIVGETMIEARQVMVQGPSGILTVTPPEERPILRENLLFWPNGVEGVLLGASDPERFRGPQFAAAW